MLFEVFVRQKVHQIAIVSLIDCFLWLVVVNRRVQCLCFEAAETYQFVVVVIQSQDFVELGCSTLSSSLSYLPLQHHPISY
jgi:hypothetical protein